MLSDEIFANHGLERGNVGYFNKEIGVNDTIGTFTFTRLIRDVQRVTEISDQGEEMIRCDSNEEKENIGPAGWHIWDEQKSRCNCGRGDRPIYNTGTHALPFDKIDFLQCVLGNFGGNAIVTYMEYKDPIYDAYIQRATGEGVSNVSGRTLQELLRLLMEWEIAVDEFTNTEAHAVAAKKYLAGMNMPEEVRSWIWDNVPGNSVQRYIEGNSRARDRELPPSITGTIVESWLVPFILEAPAIGFMTSEDWIDE
jgi:hypothetical protein